MSVPWSWRGAPLARSAQGLSAPHLMAIVNLTPDSFSDGGAHNDFARACEFARRCIADGAAIVDIGGESTRPGSASVSVDEQIARTHAVIAEIAAISCECIVSIDTTRAGVAEDALNAGAMIVNDVSAGQDDDALWPLIARRGCGYVLMHRRCAPTADSYSDRYERAPEYDDVVAHVRDWLLQRAQSAERAGIARESIAIDPGLGFGKSVAQNFELIARMDEIVALGYPVLVSASRKSFLGAATGESVPSARDSASVASALQLAKAGVAVVRAHDVRAHAEALRAECVISQETSRKQGSKGSRASGIPRC